MSGAFVIERSYSPHSTGKEGGRTRDRVVDGGEKRETPPPLCLPVCVCVLVRPVVRGVDPRKGFSFYELAKMKSKE